MFGRSTNSLWRNIGWAKKGILSFSEMPLNALSTAGVIGLFLFGALALLQVIAKLLFPELAPRGITTVLLVIVFFGALNLFAVGLLGEYIAKIFEEVKRRPHFLRRSIIRDGERREAADERAPREDAEP
jgi:dolichol-phosphate mannosyltransferase